MRLSIFHSVFSFTVLISGAAAAAATAPGCTREIPCTEQKPPADSIDIHISSPYTIRHADVFIYRDSPTRPLEVHRRTTARSLRLPSKAGDRIVLVVANSPWEFNLEALQSFDSAELLQMPYRLEDPDAPLLAGAGSTAERSEVICPKPLLSPVRILEISNRSGVLLERPALRLEGINASAEMLRVSGFYPSITVDNAADVAHPEMMVQELGVDIGERPVYPRSHLFVYPADGEETIGTQRTVLILSALADGERREWRFALPAVERGREVAMNLIVR